MDTVHPYVDVIPLGKVAAHEVLALGLPLLGETSYRGRRQPGFGAEELFEGRHEVSTREAV